MLDLRQEGNSIMVTDARASLRKPLGPIFATCRCGTRLPVRTYSQVEARPILISSRKIASRLQSEQPNTLRSPEDRSRRRIGKDLLTAF